MGVVAEIERRLFDLRCAQLGENDIPELRTSTLTHVVWAPPRWVAAARATLAGLEERHPARSILLLPEAGSRDLVEPSVVLREAPLDGLGREVYSEVIEIRLRGTPARHPGSIVLPLLVSDLPVFCRWRGEPGWDGQPLAEIVGIVDRLVVDSSEWRGLPGTYARLAGLFDAVAVSDIAWRRGLGWRGRLAELWPEIADVRRVDVTGPAADALLLAGWLRSRLGRPGLELRRRPARTLQAVRVDGRPVPAPGGLPPKPSDLLSAELEVFWRDPVYEAAVRAA